MKASWLDTIEYPFESRYFDVNGYKYHYIDEGEGKTVLFVHGTPSWSFDFRNCIKRLSSSCRCIAVDHIGFGLSDKPEVYDYSTIQHSRTLEKFILEKNLTDITLVVHDFGGPIGLHFAIRHPDRISRIIILNSWLWSSREDPDFIKISRILKSPFLPFLYKYFNFSPRFILPRSFGVHKLSGRLRRQYTQPFENKSQRNGAVAFARSLLEDQDWFQELWDERHALTRKPVMLIWGMKDPVIRPHNLEKFISGFPHAQVVRLESSGHFPQEEQPEEVTKAILGFMTETGRNG